MRARGCVYEAKGSRRVWSMSSVVVMETGKWPSWIDEAAEEIEKYERIMAENAARVLEDFDRKAMF